MPINRTLPYEAVMACKKRMPKRGMVQAFMLENCAMDTFMEKYGGPPTGVVRDRIVDTARKVAGGMNATRMAKRLRKNRKRR